MAQRGSDPAARYSVEDWNRSNAHQYETAELERMRAERGRDEHERLRIETDERHRRTQADVTQKLGQRLNDVQFWHEELSRKQAEVQQHIQRASDMLQRLQSALKDTELPLETTTRCLGYRERRRGIDLVHDNVQIELLKEKDTIEGVATVLRKTIVQVTEQLRLLRKTAYNLNKDLSGKMMALSIDADCHRRDEASVGVFGMLPPPTVDSRSVAPPEWEGFSDVNIISAEQQCHTYAKLNSISDDILNESLSDINKSRGDTNLAFQRRIEDTLEAKERLTDHLEKVDEETNAVGEDIASLQQAIQAKIPAMQLSKYRTAQRGDRPNIELVRDPVFYRLLSEAAELDDSIRQLQEAFNKAVRHYESLCARHVALSEDIETKSISLQIDSVECGGLRQRLPNLWTGQ